MQRILWLVVLLHGCVMVGRPFTRPPPGTLRLRETTQAEIAAQYGAPTQEARVIRNGLSVDFLMYHYSKADLERYDRQLCFWFHEDRLIGVRFLTTFNGEQPQIDEAKVQGVQEGVTTRRDLVVLFGEPSEELIYPMTQERDERIVSFKRVTWVYDPDAAWANQVRLRDLRVATFHLGPDDVVREKTFESEETETKIE